MWVIMSAFNSIALIKAINQHRIKTLYSEKLFATILRGAVFMFSFYVRKNTILSKKKKLGNVHTVSFFEIKLI